MAQTTMLLKIKAPTLIFTVRQGPACKINHAIVLNRRIDGLGRLSFKNVAHLSNKEQSAAINRTIRDFIDRVVNIVQQINLTEPHSMSMKKTDLYKNLALTTAQRMKNASKIPKPGAAEVVAKTKKELASGNPMLASLMGKKKPK